MPRTAIGREEKRRACIVRDLEADAAYPPPKCLTNPAVRPADEPLSRTGNAARDRREIAAFSAAFVGFVVFAIVVELFR